MLSTLTEEVAAWEDNRNNHHAKADWQFTAADAYQAEAALPALLRIERLGALEY